MAQIFLAGKFANFAGAISHFQSTPKVCSFESLPKSKSVIFFILKMDLRNLTFFSKSVEIFRLFSKNPKKKFRFQKLVDFRVEFQKNKLWGAPRLGPEISIL